MAYLWKPTAAAALLAASATPGFAQDSAETQAAPSPPAPQAPPCATEEHRAFDFWIGTWDVTPAGQDRPTATNRITKHYGDCVLREDYETGGYTGGSINFYDARRKIWHQTWMGAGGQALYLEGGPNADGAMVLSDKGKETGQPEGQYSRITWTPNADGSVRQHWELTKDNGTTWATVFDGLYVKQDEDAMETDSPE